MSNGQQSIIVREGSSEQLYHMSRLLKRMRRVRTSNPPFQPPVQGQNPELSKASVSPTTEAKPSETIMEDDATPWISAQESTVVKLTNDDEEVRELYERRPKRPRPKRTSSERYRQQLTR